MDNTNSEQMKALKELLPNCFDKEGNFINDKFNEILKQNEVDFSKETYSLSWLGKSYARLLANENPRSVIKEDENFNAGKNSRNLLIKGDNLEVLKHLKHAYYKAIKMIYIDPPYNTGDDFIYKDERNFTPEELAQKAGIAEEEAARIIEFNARGSNSHSAWLTFIYPRLYVARSLLRDDGVIFISIDDNEQAQLKILCDEIFGEENFVSCIHWRRSESQNNNSKFISVVGEFVLCYAKNKLQSLKLNKINMQETATNEYRYEDERGKFRRGTIVDNTRGNHKITITSPDGITKKINSIRTKDFVLENDKNGFIYWTKTGTPYLKIYLDDTDGQIPNNWFNNSGVNEDAADEINDIFATKIFDTPKPTKLLQKIIQLSTAPKSGGGGAKRRLAMATSF